MGLIVLTQDKLLVYLIRLLLTILLNRHFWW